MENLFNAPLFVQLTYLFLFLSTLLLWFPRTTKIPLWLLSIVVAVIFGVLGGTLNIVAVFLLMVLVVSLYFLQINKIPKIIRSISALLVFILGVGLMTHKAHGFYNLLVIDKQKITTDAIPFTLYLNFDKVALGILILGFLHQRIRTSQEWIKTLKLAYKPALFLIGIILLSSYSFHFVRFEAKLSDYLPLFMVNNLFFVCLSEEAFFRGFIQKYLLGVLEKFRFGNYFGILIAASLFGAAHYTGGAIYVLLATIAGIGYGWIYFRTQHIEASILTHFSLNLIHFLFFTYPALARV